MRILIVDDHPLVREGLATVLLAEDDMEIAGSVDNAHDAIELLRAGQPDLVLLDLRLRGESGLDVVRAARAAGSSCRFLVLTSAGGREDYRQAMDLGVEGYALKDALPEELLLALRIVAKGRRYIDPAFVDGPDHARELPGQGRVALTQKERDVLRLLGEGLSNRQIAARLFITEFTVKKHVGQILAKLEVPDRTQAALYANATGLSRYEARRLRTERTGA